MKLHCSMIFAKDMARMTAFYRDGLGLRWLAEKSSEGWAEFDAGGTSLALHAIPKPIADEIEISDPPRERGDTPLKLIFAAEDVERARAHLECHGAVMYPISKWGSCDGLDPRAIAFRS